MGPLSGTFIHAEAPSMIRRRENREQDVYQIKVKGVLDGKWSGWFEGMEVTPQPNGETLLTGPVPDQAALHGLLHKVRDMGLPLVSVKRVDAQDRSDPQLGGE
jgi:hypothetical protein